MSAAKLRHQAQVQDLEQALADELKAVHGRTLAPGEEYAMVAASLSQSALCLAGGGIRAAAFSLGVVQALARAGVLEQFDYLSSVSGGGFIGAWLNALIRQTGSVATAQAEVARPGAPAAEALRDFTNYLTPRAGMLSEDSWTGILLYLRNVIITWLGFGPVFLLAVLVAICYRTLIWTVATAVPPAAAQVFLGCGVAGLMVATVAVCMNLPGHRPDTPGTAARDYSSDHAIRTDVVLPLLVWSVGVPVALGRWLAPDADPGLLLHAWLPLIYALAITTAYWLSGWRQQALAVYRNNFSAWLAATFASALLLFGGMQLIRLAPGNLVPPDGQAEFLAVAGPLLLTVANIMQATAYVALRREALLADLDREWLARLSAVKLRLAAIWFCFALCCLTLSRVAFQQGHDAKEWPYWLVPIATCVTGPAAAWFGKQAMSRVETALDTSQGMLRLLRRLLPLLGMVFAAGLLSLLSYVTGKTLGFLQQMLPDVHLLLLVVHLCVAAVLTTLIWMAMRRINVNRFSMHGVYRNRLTRAFLGAARTARRPDPFTGFDPEDNPRLATLAAADVPRKLFPVINVTLNLTASGRAAWAERKAAAFTMTPLACGSAALSPAGGTIGAYVPTQLYGGQESESGAEDEPKGMTLATAMTISGAAVSPNWGYHSSPLTAFLMTLFNLRLGAWLPNPAVVTDAEEMAQAKPRDAFKPMLNDLFAATSDRARAIYLSDGGHFESLGLYEMLRRRCMTILLIDAGVDPECRLADLGTAIRRSRIDLGVNISFAPRMRMAARGACAAETLDFAVARIDYPDSPAPGRIVYIKPCFLDDVPPDVRAYGAAYPEFPHQNTLEPWFTESQFESYRHLGEHQITKLLALVPVANKTLDAVFDAAEFAQAGPAHVVAMQRDAA